MTRLLVSAWLVLAAIPALASDWDIDHSQSRLGFVGTQSGAEFTGEFEKFEADMRFDPDNLEASSFDVTIDVTSFNSSSSDRDSTVAGQDWFWFSQFPAATYTTESIRQTGPDEYEALGKLTIRKKTRTVNLPFKWVIDGDTAKMDGQTTLTRTHFNVGIGEWRSGKTVGLKVEVQVDLTLTR